MNLLEAACLHIQLLQLLNYHSFRVRFLSSVHTSKDGAELLPAGDATLRGELTQGDLQEEDWQTSAKQENEVGDEKCTCVEERKDGATAGKMNKSTER